MALLSKTQAAEMLGQKTKTLDNWRYTGTGPQYVRLPKSVMYEESALLAFIKACRVEPVASTI